ncbi:pseudouridine synthase family protein [Chitinimonas naiadis]
MLSLLADHTSFLLVNKPADLNFHREDNEAGLLELLREQTGHDNLHAVHRLDRLTSGLLLVAKGPQAAARFGELFSSRQIGKYYLALSDRNPKKKQGGISGDMEKGRNGSWRLLNRQDDPARTQFFTAGLGNGLRGFILRPLTGRTHQLRVAMKALGSPILGDSRYAGSPADRGYLHAYALAFVLDGEAFRFVCPPDVGEHWQTAECQDVLRRFTNPWTLAWPKG